MKNTILIFLIFINCGFCLAQQKITLGNSHQISSKYLNEDRILNIYTPEGYNPDSTITYPVIYLLDGSENEDFIHIVGIVQFLSMAELMPKTIVVGIANVDRKRDFTFPTTIEKDKKDFPTTGSSAKFINFLANEVQPFVERSFKTNASKMLIGQSLGGLLATEILLKRPSVFNIYAIVSPSLWWNNQSLLNDVSNDIVASKENNTRVFISVGEEGKIMKDDAKRLAETLSKSKELNVNFEFLEKEDHATILHNSIYQTLLKIYKKK